MRFPYLIPLFLFLIFLEACVGSRRGTLEDLRDGQVYQTVKIGDQWWMAENLRYLPYLSSLEADDGIWIYAFDDIYIPDLNEISHYRDWGCLYSWAIAMNIPVEYNQSYFHDTLSNRQGICPDGWHLPSDREWSILESYLDTDPSFTRNEERRNSGNAGEKLKSESGWSQTGNETNESGFGALPAGMRYQSGFFHHGDEIAYFWTATEIYEGSAWYRCLMDSTPGTYRGYPEKSNGFSVRCVMDPH